jgi:hypothetical protein
MRYRWLQTARHRKIVLIRISANRTQKLMVEKFLTLKNVFIRISAYRKQKLVVEKFLKFCPLKKQ